MNTDSSIYQTAMGWRVAGHKRTYQTYAAAAAAVDKMETAQRRRSVMAAVRRRASGRCEHTNDDGRCGNHDGARVGVLTIALKVIALNHDSSDARINNFAMYCQLCRHQHESLGTAALFEIAEFVGGGGG